MTMASQRLLIELFKEYWFSHSPLLRSSSCSKQARPIIQPKKKKSLKITNHCDIAKKWLDHLWHMTNGTLGQPSAASQWALLLACGCYCCYSGHRHCYWLFRLNLFFNKSIWVALLLIPPNICENPPISLNMIWYLKSKFTNTRFVPSKDIFFGETRENLC